MNKLSPSDRAAYIASVMEHGKKRAAHIGVTFNADDFLMGASVIFAVTDDPASLPSDWIYSLMAGRDQLTGENPTPIEHAINITDRIKHEANYLGIAFDNADGEDLEGIDFGQEVANLIRTVGRLRRLFRANKAAQERAAILCEAAKTKSEVTV